MAKFGVIAEGPCDQQVIENILIGYFGDQEEPVINPIQPATPASGADAAHGGWTLVFASLRRGDPQLALGFNDYVVIHIDTDVQEEAGFDVPRREDGVELSIPDRVRRVISKLTNCIDAPCYQAHASRILFAVAVDTIECWLLPLLYSNNKVKKTTGCLGSANVVLRRAGKNGLSGADGAKFPKAYNAASREYQKHKTLMEHRDKNPSLTLFIEQLDAALAQKTESGSTP
jgi:hypothetical protein